ncbi:MAG: hypothetical protein LUC34_05115 [Campylobacter sp.]|nr:hypothetical protein [Campylobacter sp.]
MAAKIFTKGEEESLITTIISNGLKFRNSEISKYVILRLAIVKAFKLEYKALDDQIWAEKCLKSTNSSIKGAEYNLDQVTGRGKDSDNYDEVFKAMFSLKHRDENKDFNDDNEFVRALNKYIHRGLYEISNTYKSTDDFYQWLIDELKLKHRSKHKISGEIKA